MSLLGYPKGRDLIIKIGSIARTDSSTPKLFLQKGAIVAYVMVHQQTVAVTANASYNLGWSGSTTALLNAYSLTTGGTGLAMAGTTVGTGVLAVPLTADQQVIGTFTVGGSSAGGTGYFVVAYFVPGPGEVQDS